MKVAFLSVAKDGSGYANAAVEYMLAAEAAGIDVVSRSVTLGRADGHEADARIKHLEAKDLRGVDVVLQNCIPNTFERKGGVRNVGLFYWETTDLRRTSWAPSCNLMDEIWTSCLQSRHSMINSGITVPVRTIPCACDVARFDQPGSPLAIPETRGKCVFYSVGELSRRKNVVGLLRAYYAAFQKHENVILILKFNLPGQGHEAVHNRVRMLAGEVKNTLGLHHSPDRYPPVVCMGERLSASQLDQLHRLGDVFVTASHGESWCVPAHDALGFGNPIIAPRWGSFPELLHDHAVDRFDSLHAIFGDLGPSKAGWLTPGQTTFAFGGYAGEPALYAGDEQWFDPDLPCLARQLQSACDEWRSGALQQRRDAAKQRARKFSHQYVGQLIVEVLAESC